MSNICIVLGSVSDKPIFDKMKPILADFGLKYEVRIASAHRTPERVREIVMDSDADVFIAVAGLSASLPGVVASFTTKPVIGVPVNAALDGQDALLSIAQMPPGVPVACVGIDCGANAVLLAAEILSLNDDSLVKKLDEYRKKQREKIEKADQEAKTW
jgi:5-(carboxyamino)imidazole ribonucleotide mutase